jgi:hypothetical protein
MFLVLLPIQIVVAGQVVRYTIDWSLRFIVFCLVFSWFFYIAIPLTYWCNKFAFDILEHGAWKDTFENNPKGKKRWRLWRAFSDRVLRLENSWSALSVYLRFFLFVLATLLFLVLVCVVLVVSLWP